MSKSVFFRNLVLKLRVPVYCVKKSFCRKNREILRTLRLKNYSQPLQGSLRTSRARVQGYLRASQAWEKGSLDASRARLQGSLRAFVCKVYYILYTP